MTPSLIIRPVLVCIATAALSSCGMIDSDPHRFENLANTVAAIPLEGGKPTAPAGTRTAVQAGLRPAIRVEVMEPHALWDARDGDMNRVLDRAAPRLVATAAPAVTKAVLDEVSSRLEPVSVRVGLRPALASRPVPVRDNRGLVQLGAYSSEAAARAAWARLKAGEAAWALNGLSPVYEAVEVGGRRLTRLKVRTPSAGAAAVCAAARIDDPWCRRAT